MYEVNWLTALVVVVVGLLAVLDAVQSDGGPEGPVEAAHEAYIQDEITLDELEARLEYSVDDRTQRLRADLERINGVGPETSKAITREFRTRGQLQQADVEELTAVHDVGPSTADAVIEHVRSDDRAVADNAMDGLTGQRHENYSRRRFANGWSLSRASASSPNSSE